MCASLEKLFGGSSVLDMGAGRAHYGRCFLRAKENIIRTKNKNEVERMNRMYTEQMQKGGLLDKPQVVKSWTGEMLMLCVIDTLLRITLYCFIFLML